MISAEDECRDQRIIEITNERTRASNIGGKGPKDIQRDLHRKCMNLLQNRQGLHSSPLQERASTLDTNATYTNQ